MLEHSYAMIGICSHWFALICWNYAFVLSDHCYVEKELCFMVKFYSKKEKTKTNQFGFCINAKRRYFWEFPFSPFTEYNTWVRDITASISWLKPLLLTPSRRITWLGQLTGTAHIISVCCHWYYLVLMLFTPQTNPLLVRLVAAAGWFCVFFFPKRLLGSQVQPLLLVFSTAACWYGGLSAKCSFQNIPIRLCGWKWAQSNPMWSGRSLLFVPVLRAAASGF